MIKIILVILLIYLMGCGLALNLVTLVEYIKNQRFSKDERIKLALGSWYTCIIMNNILSNHD